MPVPYREKVHEIVSQTLNSDYLVIYCAKLEPNRQWKFKYGNYDKIFLADVSKGYIHNNIAIWRALNRSKPEVIISTGFNPTMLYAFIWSILHRAKFIPFTDGTYDSEKKLSLIHGLVRKIVFFKSYAFIGAGNGSSQLYQSYKIPNNKIFKSCLAIDNSLFKKSTSNKEYTLMFSGRLVEGKMPFFFVEVARKVKELTGNCNVLILGSGELANEIGAMLDGYKISYNMPGFIDQKQLPNFYPKSKLFLLPTKGDAWGIVANEAMAAGVPVITCEEAGVANDLVIDNINGYILPLNVDIWAEMIVKILSNDELYAEFAKNAYTHVQKYNFKSAADGIIDAIDFTFANLK